MDWGYVIINAIVLACIYGTLAIGVSITWSSLGLINMSFGLFFPLQGTVPGWLPSISLKAALLFWRRGY